jgi:hypothetical protein
MKTYTTVHISQINSGDTILHNGEEKTVSTNNIKNCSFIGKSLFGDSYNCGHKLVTKIKFNLDIKK